MDTYDPTKRLHIGMTSVVGLIEFLQSAPQDALVVCCGCDDFYLHVSKDDSVVCIDTEDDLGSVDQ